MKYILVIAVFILGSALLSSCTLNGNREAEAADLSPYKNSYVGDNSAVGGIIAKLPGYHFYKDMALHTSEKPYGIEIHYGAGKESGDLEEYLNYWGEDQYKEITTGNAKKLFELIPNADQVTFRLDDPIKQTITVTREEMKDVL